MRKADYQALAQIIASKVAAARAGLQVDPASLAFRAAFNVARDIAHEFAKAAAVDRTAFLTACGLEP